MYTILHHLLPSGHGILNLIRYVTFRSGAALGLSLLLTLIAMPFFIKKIRQYSGFQPVRTDGPESHLEKRGTPTMGGLMIIISAFISSIMFTDLTNHYVQIMIATMLLFGLIGFIDDYLKVSKANPKGLSGRKKLIMQYLFATIAVMCANYINDTESYKNVLTFPFFKDLAINLGIVYSIMRITVIVGASNAVNLTDGLDGLVTIPVIFNCFVWAVFCYLIGHVNYSSYLWLNHQPGVEEISIFLSSVIGASLGFLWYNAKPAQIIMGDCGSLSLGGILGVTAVIIKQEVLLGITGGIFAIEAISVIIQVYYFKLTKGKRIFKMAPIHHHFEKCGCSEMQVVIRFWIVSLIFCLIGLASLKLR